MREDIYPDELTRSVAKAIFLNETWNQANFSETQLSMDHTLLEPESPLN